jgi:hypothetical protein
MIMIILLAFFFLFFLHLEPRLMIASFDTLISCHKSVHCSRSHSSGDEFMAWQIFAYALESWQAHAKIWRNIENFLLFIPMHEKWYHKFFNNFLQDAAHGTVKYFLCKVNINMWGMEIFYIENYPKNSFKMLFNFYKYKINFESN